jgi:uncharacterized OsmC-like protein
MVRLGPTAVTADVEGDIETEGKVLVIKRIRVTYHLETPLEDKDKVDRAYSVHAESCPVYRSIHRAIEVTTELDWREMA